MKYIKPTIKLDEAQAAMMIAESLKVNEDSEKTVDGENSLTKENAWDIWDED